MRTSATSPCNVALILIGSAIRVPSVQLSAPADGHLHLFSCGVEPAVRFHDCANVGSLAQLDAHGCIRLYTTRYIENRHERKRILLRDDRYAFSVRYSARHR